MDDDIMNFLEGVDPNEEEVEEEIPYEPPQDITPQQNPTTRALRIKIRKYIKAFPDELGHIDISDIDDLSERELQSRYDDVRTELNSVENTLITGCYFTAINITENLAPLAGMNLTGLTASCRMNEGICKSLKQLQIEYGDYSLLTRPEERLAYLTLITILNCHQSNKKQIEQQQQITKKHEDFYSKELKDEPEADNIEKSPPKF